MRWPIIVGGAAVLALAGCGATRVEAPRTEAPGTGASRAVAPVEESAFTRTMIKRDERRALLQADASDETEQHEGRPPCALFMEEVPGGLALVFTAPGESVPELRQRVRAIAERYNRRDPHARKLTEDLLTAKVQVSAVASEQSVPGGARLVLRTEKPREVEALRALMRWHAADLLPGVGVEAARQGPCPTVPKPLMG